MVCHSSAVGPGNNPFQLHREGTERADGNQSIVTTLGRFGRLLAAGNPETGRRRTVARLLLNHFVIFHSFIHSFVSIRRLLLSRHGGRTQPTTVATNHFTNHVAHIRWPFKVQFYFSLNQPQDGLARKRGRCCTEMCRKCESNRLQWSVQSATGTGKFGEIIYIEI